MRKTAAEDFVETLSDDEVAHMLEVQRGRLREQALRDARMYMALVKTNLRLAGHPELAGALSILMEGV
jgi:hypothetical protein